MQETFASLLHDPAHWEFEMLVGFLEMLIFDGIVIGFFWPFLRKHWKHHIARDEFEAVVGLPQFVNLGPLKTPGNCATQENWSGTKREDGLTDNPFKNLVELPLDDTCSDCGGTIFRASEDVARCPGCGAIYDAKTLTLIESAASDAAL